MQFTIHRGTHEIGGSCVEIESRRSRIVIDIGMPLVNSTGERFDFKPYRNLTNQELVKEKILPDIKGFYKWDNNSKPIDGLLISHAHLDHYGLFRFLRGDIPYFLGEGTKKIIDLTGVLIGPKVNINNYTHFKSGEPFQVGAFT